MRRYRITLDQAARLGVSGEWPELARAGLRAHQGGAREHQEKIEMSPDLGPTESPKAQ